MKSKFQYSWANEINMADARIPWPLQLLTTSLGRLANLRSALVALALTSLTVVCGCILLLLLLLDFHSGGFAAEPPTVAPRSVDEAGRLFETLVPQVEISLSAEALQSLRTQPREYVKVTLREGTNVFANVGLKLKGSRGSFRPVDDRPALTLNVDKFQKGQTFHGLDKLHLNNSVQDPTLMDEMICSELFRLAGVPTARATLAHVKFNARELGFYVLKEGYNNRFLKRNYKDASGNLYDGGFLMDVDEALKKDAGTGANDWSDLVKLADAANEPDLAKRKERLEGILDVDKFMTFSALEMLTCDWDGYVQNRNNYRLYHDPSTGKFVFIPHGLDQMFGDVNYPITPGGSGRSRGRFRGFRRSGLVADGVFEVMDFQRRYLDRMGELLKKEFTVDTLNAEINRIESKIRAQVGRSDPQFVNYMSRCAQNLRRQVDERVRFAQAQHAALMRRLRPE